MNQFLLREQPIVASDVKGMFQKRLPGDCKVKVLPLNRRRVQVRRGFFILCEVQVKKDALKIEKPLGSHAWIVVLPVPTDGHLHAFKAQGP